MAIRRKSAAGVRLWILVVVLLAAVPAAPGCRTWRPAPIDLSDPAWRVDRHQAVWHPADRPVELAGELWLATTRNRNGYLQFAKGPIVLAEARVDPGHWLARFPSADRTVSGSGEAPARLAWNELLRVAVGGTVRGDWAWTGSLAGQWRLEDRASGEWIEGTRLP